MANYYKSQLEGNGGNIKKAWDVTKKASNLGKSNFTGPTIIHNKGKIYDKSIDIANQLINSYFSQIATDLASGI